MVNIIKLQDRRDGKQYPIRMKGITSLGSGADNNIVYRPKGNIVIEKPIVVNGIVGNYEKRIPESNLVSTTHCVFDYRNGELQIMDQSDHGTYVNGMLVGKGFITKLEPGYRIGIGKRTLDVVVEPEAFTKFSSMVVKYGIEMFRLITQGPKTIYDI